MAFKAVFSRAKEVFNHYFCVPRNNPDLTLAQHRSLSRHIPLFYIVLVANTAVVAVTHLNIAPPFLTIVVPVLLSGVVLTRVFAWLSMRKAEVTADQALQALRRTNLLTIPLAGFFTAWALVLHGYGDAYHQGQVTFFVAITVIACIFSLMHLRSAALSVALVVNVPLLVFMVLTGEPTFIATAINIAIVSVAMLSVLQSNYNDFAQLTVSRQALLLQQRELEKRTAAVQRLSNRNLSLARLDSLTDLGNRRSFFERFDQIVETCGGERFAIGILDLDSFKPINDLHGHAVGDHVLVEVGTRLREFSRDGVEIFRLGGDEFGFIMRNTRKVDAIVAFGDRICGAVARPIALPTGYTSISASVGCAIYPLAATDPQLLYERADYALYEAKRNKGSGVVVFSGAQEQALTRKHAIERALVSSNLEDEMYTVFQPIVELRGRRIVGFEALGRWANPQLGEISPMSFIPLAERTGQISAISRILLRKSLTALKDWPEDVYVSVNLSAHDIANSESILRLLGIINESGADPERIDFEITETAIVQDFEQAKTALNMLRNLGANVALDDFGTGYSSLSYIHRLPFNKIKVDRSFVAEIESSGSSFKIVKSLLMLCNDMGLKAIAEGVETADQLRVLRQLGCNKVQGYYFSRPMPAGDVLPFLDSFDAHEAIEAANPELKRQSA
ncbi:putative bifunctional diguanylate cyclase/phosphodiesterase [Rhodobium gokarnense]|uniref:Diguanylate cyclase (GGDEF)-like protein n=1 Tax=Rhodobium gokarnense TaxID=364296 RepID=A0ABT3HDR6_9HYPH|nr:EAL domain-containing protein [Rhodobium gokarnense]MCW2308552.1 diguanylate cyclase (GGDEF)-like protein [Rhodobium gokarnense]